MLDHAMRRGLTGAIVHSQQDRAAAQDPARGGRGRRGPDLRPPRATATTRCRRSSRCSPTARPTPAPPRCGPRRSRSGSSSASSTATSRGWRPTSTTALQTLRAARHHQRHPARRHEDRGRAVRRRQDAAAVRAAVGRDHEEGRGLPRAADGAGRGPGEGHDRARHGQGRRPRHRQEPGRHHPDQQRLPGGQSRHQAAARRDPGGRDGAQGRRDRHVRPPGQVDRDHAREPGGDAPPGPARAGAARRRRADPRLRRGRLLEGLRRGPGRLRPRRLRRPDADGQGGDRRLRRPTSPSGSRKAAEPQRQEAAHAGLRQRRRGRPGRCGRSSSRRSASGATS